jgi:hypothetical protein
LSCESSPAPVFCTATDTLPKRRKQANQRGLTQTLAAVKLTNGTGFNFQNELLLFAAFTTFFIIRCFVCAPA